MPSEVFIPVALTCAALVLYQYHRVNRLAGGIGWAILILAVGAFGSGMAEVFAWSGLLFGAIGALGLIIALQELAYHRHNRRRARQQNRDSSGG